VKPLGQGKQYSQYFIECDTRQDAGGADFCNQNPPNHGHVLMESHRTRQQLIDQRDPSIIIMMMMMMMMIIIIMLACLAFSLLFFNP
jgi:hypothetical protein